VGRLRRYQWSKKYVLALIGEVSVLAARIQERKMRNIEDLKSFIFVRD
jgi:hypothetical protein